MGKATDLAVNSMSIIFLYLFKGLTTSHDLCNLEQWTAVACNHEIVRTFADLQ